MEYLHSNFSLKSHNSFGVHSKAQFLYEFSETAEIEKFAREELKRFQTFKILGSGNNILLRNDLEGVIIKPKGNKIEIISSENDNVIVRAEAGTDWDWLVEYCMKQKWYGLENLSLIPGSVGAAPVQNIGAYGVEIEQFIESIEVIDLLTAKTYNIKHKDCNFGYRNSTFKKSTNQHLLILSVKLKLWLNPKPNLTYKALSILFDSKDDIDPEKIREAVIKIRNTKLPDPKILGNAGSFFKNPIVSNTTAKLLTNQYPDIPHWKNSDDKTKFSAAWFIEQCGFKGYVSESGVGTYIHQPLVLVNHGKASGNDIWSFAEEIISQVKNRFGIELEPEVNIW